MFDCDGFRQFMADEFIGEEALAEVTHTVVCEMVNSSTKDIIVEVRHRVAEAGKKVGLGEVKRSVVAALAAFSG